MAMPAPAKAGMVSSRSRRLVSKATENQRVVAPQGPAVRRAHPPSEVDDADTTVQRWLDRQEQPFVAEGSLSKPAAVPAVPQHAEQQPAVKCLFPSSPRKPRTGTRTVNRKIPFKRGRGSGSSSVKDLTSSPGTNWKKQLPSISVRTTISPGKLDSNNPNILIEVSTPSKHSPGKWNVVSSYHNIGSPSASGIWDVEECEVGQEVVVVTTDDAEGLAEPLNADTDKNQPAPPVNRKRSSKIKYPNPPKVRMLCREESQPEFFLEEDDDDDPGEAHNVDSQEQSSNQGINLPTTAQPANSKTKKRVDGPRPNTRKRTTNTSNWKLNVAKKGYNDGTEYVTSRGTLKKAREIKPACSDKCNRCERVLLPQERHDIFENFWALDDITKKRDYISRLIDEHVPTTCSTSPECAKKSIRRYHFVIDNQEVRVCKTMFINTLGVADVWIETTLKKITSTGLVADGRGKHKNRPKRISEVTLQSVRDHIQLFPKVYSHYTRERTKREYLETHVHSVERMYKLYGEWAKEKDVEKIASLSAYRKVFNTEFNLGFFLPRKDQCETCARWKTSLPDQRREMVKEYATHLENKKKVKALKDADKAGASATVCVACFDLQKVLICPRSEVSLFFYHNKISLYNFTVFDLRLCEGHCYLWTEVDAAKGPNEIGTNLLNFIEKKIDDGVTEFVFYSDSPTGQNRNRMMFSLYLHASVKYNIKIIHRFLESGHSYSEADSMHARIEGEAKVKQEIYTPKEWETLIKSAKQDGKPYIVNHLENEEVLDLHALVNVEDWDKDTKKEKVFWSKVREVSADCKSPNCIFYRYNFSDEPSKILVKLKNGGTTDHKTYKFPPAYKSKFPLPDKKKKDIRNLMRKGAIPHSYHATFESYLAI